MLDWLNAAAFHLFSTPVSWAELFGDITGLVCVWWTARQHIANWPAGLANNVLFFVLFIDAKLYGDSLLQVIFFALGVYGWVQWHQERPEDAAPVRRTSSVEWQVLAAVTAGGWMAAWLWLDRVTDSPVPIWDALVLILSLVATYGQARKLVESWWIWITVDVISIPLYIERDLYPTAGLYVVFLTLCIVGLRDWRRAMVPPSAVGPVDVGAVAS